MDRSNVINLISEKFERDNKGVMRPVVTKNKVYCDVDSVIASEFFEGHRNGLNPELRFRMFRYDYQGEQLVEFENNIYKIYRTYLGRDDTLELYVERRKGHEQPDNS